MFLVVMVQYYCCVFQIQTLKGTWPFSTLPLVTLLYSSQQSVLLKIFLSTEFLFCVWNRIISANSISYDSTGLLFRLVTWFGQHFWAILHMYF